MQMHYYEHRIGVPTQEQQVEPTVRLAKTSLPRERMACLELYYVQHIAHENRISHTHTTSMNERRETHPVSSRGHDSYEMMMDSLLQLTATSRCKELNNCLFLLT